MNNIKVEVNLSKEDRELLEKISVLMAENLAAVSRKNNLLQKLNDAPVVDLFSPEVVQECEQDPEAIITADDGLPFDLEGPDMPKISLGDIRKKVTQLRASKDPKKKDGAKDIIKSYAENITGLPEDKYLEIWEKLTALEREG